MVLADVVIGGGIVGILIVVALILGILWLARHF